jgi:hypothetical protein
MPTLHGNEEAVIKCHILPTQEHIIVGLPSIRKHFKQATIAVLLEETQQPESHLNIAHMTLALEPVSYERYGPQLNHISPAVDNALRVEIEQLRSKGHDILQVDLTSTPAPEDDLITDLEIFPSGYNSTGAYEKRVEEYNTTFPTRIGKEYRAHKRLNELLASNVALNSFTSRKWQGIDVEPIHIHFHDTLPDTLKQRTRPVPEALKIPAKNALDEFTDHGFLKFALQGAYGAGMVPVPKDELTARICGDFRAINAHMKSIPLIMPDPMAAVEVLSRFSLFAECDWRNAFHQLPLDAISAERLAITTPWGLFQPQFVPEGIACGSALLMATAMKIFHDFTEWMVPVHDNILIGATDIDDLCSKLELLFKRCAQYRIQLKASKSNFAVTELKFFGFVLTKGHIKSDPQRIEEIVNIPMPKTTKQMQSFLGLMTYISPFVPDYHKATSTLFDMTVKGFNWDSKSWTRDYTMDFEKCKQAAAASIELHLPDTSCLWLLCTDACASGCAWVLVQYMHLSRLSAAQQEMARAKSLVDKEGMVAVPIALGAKKFSEAATRWSVTDQELFAVVCAYKKLERLLIMKPHCLATDHMNLVTLKATEIQASPKHQRWRAWLAQFPFYLRHIPGVKNTIADYLSRSWTDEKTASIANITLTDIFKDVHDGVGGHRGIKDTWLEINKRYPAAEVTLDQVRTYVNDCPTCVKIWRTPRDSHTATKALPVYHARAVTHVDVLEIEQDELGNRYLFVFINALTKYTVIYPAPQHTAAAFCRALLTLMATVGITEVVWADQGKEFLAEASKIMAQILGTAFTFTIANRPQANGVVERLNSSILRELRILALRPMFKKRWSDPNAISLLQLLLNTRVHTSTGFAPVTLTFGQWAQQWYTRPEDMATSEGQPTTAGQDALRNFDEHLREIQDTAKQNIIKSQSRRLMLQPEFTVRYQPGDLVLRDPFTNTGHVGYALKPRKLLPRYLGPYKVIQQQPNSNSVDCHDYLDAGKLHTFHHDTLTLFIGTHQDALNLLRLDSDEEPLDCITDHKGNSAVRTEMQFKATFADGSQAWITWQEAQPTIALQQYMDQFIFGRGLAKTMIQQKQFADATNPAKNETLTHAIQRLPQNMQPALYEERWLTAHYFHSADWYTDDPQVGLISRTAGNELVFSIRVTKFSAKRLEIQIPVLEFYHANKRSPFRMDITLADMITYSISKLIKPKLNDNQIELKKDKQPLVTIRAMILESKGLQPHPSR